MIRVEFNNFFKIIIFEAFEFLEFSSKSMSNCCRFCVDHQFQLSVRNAANVLNFVKKMNGHDHLRLQVSVAAICCLNACIIWFVSFYSPRPSSSTFSEFEKNYLISVRHWYCTVKIICQVTNVSVVLKVSEASWGARKVVLDPQHDDVLWSSGAVS